MKRSTIIKRIAECERDINALIAKAEEYPKKGFKYKNAIARIDEMEYHYDLLFEMLEHEGKSETMPGCPIW